MSIFLSPSLSSTLLKRSEEYPSYVLKPLKIVKLLRWNFPHFLTLFFPSESFPFVYKHDNLVSNSNGNAVEAIWYKQLTITASLERTLEVENTMYLKQKIEFMLGVHSKYAHGMKTIQCIGSRNDEKRIYKMNFVGFFLKKKRRYESTNLRKSVRWESKKERERELMESGAKSSGDKSDIFRTT